jgi:hypothetical protein
MGLAGDGLGLTGFVAGAFSAGFGATSLVGDFLGVTGIGIKAVGFDLGFMVIGCKVPGKT